MNKSIHEGGMEINPLREKYDALKVITYEMAIEALTQFEEVDRLKQSLKRARSTLDSLEEKVWLLKDKFVETCAHYFEKTRR